MPRIVSAEVQAALEARSVVARDFVTFVVRNRDTGEPVIDHIWSDVGNVTAEVASPLVGTESRFFVGSGTLLEISNIPMVANLTVQNITVTINHINDHIEQLVRDYDCKQGRFEVYRGLYSPASRALVAPAECRFLGFIDTIEIKTGSEGDESSTVMTCVSHTQEMTRSNPDTRSHASQLLRAAGDSFYLDSSVTGEWEVFWGSQKGKVPTSPKRKKFLGIF